MIIQIHNTVQYAKLYTIQIDKWGGVILYNARLRLDIYRNVGKISPQYLELYNMLTYIDRYAYKCESSRFEKF